MTGDDFDLTVRCLACGDALNTDFECVSCDERDGFAESQSYVDNDFLDLEDSFIDMEMEDRMSGGGIDWEPDYDDGRFEFWEGPEPMDY